MIDSVRVRVCVVKTAIRTLKFGVKTIWCGSAYRVERQIFMEVQ